MISNCPILPSASWPKRKARAFVVPATRPPARPRTFRSAAPCGSRMARRIALRRPRPETIARARGRDGGLRRARRADLLAEIEALKAKASPDSLHRPDRHPLSPLRDRAEAGGPGGDVLPDGRVGLDVRAHEGPRQAVLHAALRVSDAALPPCRDRLHPSYRPGRRGRRGDVLPWAGLGRHAGVERAAGDARDRQVAVSSGGLEHLCRAGLRRRQFAFRRRDA